MGISVGTSEGGLTGESVGVVVGEADSSQSTNPGGHPSSPPPTSTKSIQTLKVLLQIGFVPIISIHPRH